MREELKALENQTVAVTGRIIEIRKYDGGIDMLVKNCDVRPWDHMSKVLEADPVHTDHLWLRVEGGPTYTERKSSELLQKILMVGRIRYYRRADGESVDLGFEVAECISIDELAFAARSAYIEYQKTSCLDSLRVAIERLKTALSALLSEDYAYSVSYTRDESVSFLGRQLVKMERTYISTHSKLATVHKGGKCTGLDTFKVRASKPRVACGF